MVTIVKYHDRMTANYKIIVDGKVRVSGLMYYHINEYLRLLGYAHECKPMYDNAYAMVSYQ